MSIPFRLQVPRRLLDEIIAQSRAELPNECCGLLAGRIVPAADPEQAPVGQVVRRFPLVNAAASPVEYDADGRGLCHAHRQMRDLDLIILAIYHSHPTIDPIPSRKDMERNYSEDVVNLIVSLKGAEATLGVWWLTANNYRPVEWECLP